MRMRHRVFLVVTLCTVCAIWHVWYGFFIPTGMTNSSNGDSTEMPFKSTPPKVSNVQGIGTFSTIESPNTFDGVVARVFTPYNHPFPCFHPTDNQTTGRWPGRHPPLEQGPTQNGFLYVKIPKTGSSSGAGVHLRIARNVARRSPSYNFDICKARCRHGKAHPHGNLRLAQRDVNASFVWTLVREPTQRAVSSFFHFQVARRAIEPTDDNFVRYLPRGHVTINYLSPREYHYRKGYNPIEYANEILLHYDFIGLTERIDESLVVLSMLLDLPLTDILSVSAKRNGGYDDGASQNTCFKIPPSFVSPGMQRHFASGAWRNLTRPEVALFQAVNRSLDLTMDALGRSAVQARLVRYRQAMAMVNERCTADTVKLPCTKDGVRREDVDVDCFFQDLACGMDCLDRVAAEIDL